MNCDYRAHIKQETTSMQNNTTCNHCPHPAEIIIIDGCNHWHITHTTLCHQHAAQHQKHKKTCTCGQPILEQETAHTDGTPAPPQYYPGEWVATRDNKTLAHNPNPHKLIQQLRETQNLPANIWQVKHATHTHNPPAENTTSKTSPTHEKKQPFFTRDKKKSSTHTRLP